MKRTLFIVTIFIAFFVGVVPSFATNGTRLIGIGSTQKGMAGAVTAAPEDAMTAITNPAGMALIGKRADFNGEAFMPQRSVDFGDLPPGPPPGLGGPGEDESGGTELYGIPSLGWSAPAFMRDDVYFGGGFFGVSGMGVDYDLVDAGATFGTGDIFSVLQYATIAPAIAWNVNEQLTIGVSVNFDYQLLEIKQRYSAPALAGVPFLSGEIALELDRASTAYGGGATVGAIYKVNDTVSVGASYSSKQWLQDLKYRGATIENFPVGNFFANNDPAGGDNYKLDLDYPQQAAVGVAVKPMEALTIAFDVRWIDWDDTYDEAELSGDFILTSTMGSATAVNSIDLPFGWDDQWIFSIGARYDVNEKLTLRCGYNYSESPIDDEDVFSNIAFPAIVEHHATLGATYNFGPHWSLTGSYMHAFQNDVSGKGDVPQAFQSLGFAPDTKTEIELEENSLGLQVTYHF
jgi:long-chain fatty acid transport protein